MRDRALKFLGEVSSSLGGAAVGVALTTTVGAATGPIGLTGCFGIWAVCLLTNTLADQSVDQAQITRVETWLEELVRRHGSMEAAIKSIAEGIDTNEFVSSQNAKAIITLAESSHECIEDILSQNCKAQELLDSISDNLIRLDGDVIAKLDRQASSLSSIELKIQEACVGIDGIHLELSQMNRRTDSDEELVKHAVDSQESCRLRTERLQTHLDQFEWDSARSYADKSEEWFRRSRKGLSHIEQARLLERLIEEATLRIKLAEGEKKSEALNRLQDLMAVCRSITSQLDEQDNLRISSHLAYAESVVNGTDSGLALIAGRMDPYGIRRHLSILLDAELYNQAWDLICDEEPIKEWINKGIMAACYTQNWARAEQLLDWSIANSPPRIQHLSRLIYTECVVNEVIGKAVEKRFPLAEVEAARLELCIDRIKPLVDFAVANNTPRHEFDCIALRLSIQLYSHLGRSSELQRVVQNLERHQPFDALLANFALGGRIAANQDWPRRLRSEGKANFHRRYLAAHLEMQDSTTINRASRAALRLAREAESEVDQKKMPTLLMDISQRLGGDARSEFDDQASEFLDPDDKQMRLWSAARLLESGKISEADLILNELRDEDDPHWLQIQGQRSLQNNDVESGVDQLAKASLILDLPDMIDNVAALAVSHSKWEIAVKLLNRLVVIQPADIQARSNRAMVLHHLGQHEHAAGIFVELAIAQPTVGLYSLNAAICLIRSGRPDEAVEILQNPCEQSDASLQMVVCLAQVLTGRGQAKQAFSMLERHRERLWGEYEFVGLYWTTAYAAEEEETGHEAFNQMRILQSEGAAPADILVEKSLDDLLAHGEEYDKRQRAAALDLVQGKTSWLAVADTRRDSVYGAWAIRTGSYPWILENHINISNTTVYSSNGYTVISDDEERSLEVIQSSGQGQPIVVDLTALITLQQLGLLDAVAGYCGRIHVPANYLMKMFEDNSSLRPHQPSRRTALQEARTAITNTRIGIDGDEENNTLRNVDEHYPKGHAPGEVCHLADILNTLRSAGAATTDQLNRLERVAQRSPTATEEKNQIHVGDPLRISLSTLSTLHAAGVLDIVIQEFHVHVSTEDHRAIEAQFEWFQKQEKLRVDHNELWKFLRDDPRVVKGTKSVSSSSSEDMLPHIELQASVIASELQLPILIDDRFLQAITLNHTNSSKSAFGTAQVLQSMADDRHISLDQYATAIRCLMRWRYRFILPDHKLLLYWARQSMESIPGPDLKEVAKYFRACLRDPGLFSGIEPTDTPSTVALKYYQSIEAAVGKFVASLWVDEQISEEQAKSLTEWSLVHLLPSPPASMEPRIRIISSLPFSLFWIWFFLRLVQNPVDRTSVRSRRGVQVVGEALGMPPENIIRVATEIIDGFDR